MIYSPFGSKGAGIMGQEDLDVFVLTDEEGHEHHFVILAEIEDGMKKYWICEEIMMNEEGEIEQFGDIYPFEVKEAEDGGLYIDSVQSEEEFERVSKAWEELLEKDEELRKLVEPEDQQHE
ncbi:MAG: hypothetical protein XD58_0193 [Thermotoga sp. 50_1627]|nr:MAG: hypothetical protein XD45_0433 [Thermotoga sp. 50_64]KUK25756.1 MAG: hypothetical protein XD58_0193 [Thermotoga sp. 50_1627]MDK2923620.1 hypothetical protein [Pseudothermotoga sp.]